MLSSGTRPGSLWPGRVSEHNVEQGREKSSALRPRFLAVKKTRINYGLPLVNWTVLGVVPEFSPGLFAVNDPQAANSTRRCACQEINERR